MAEATDKRREVALAVNKAKKQLDFALEGMWDARTRGDKEDFEFFRSAVVRSTNSLRDWITKLSIRLDSVEANDV